MRISKVSLIACLAGVAAWQLHAQTASPELQGKALELLHKAISEDRQQANAVPPISQPASPDQQERALQLLRQKVTEPAPAAPPKSAKAPSSKSTAPKKSATSPSEASAAVKQSGGTAPADASSAPVESPLSKTKQQRLMDLLEQYKADKLTPAEYQTQRAKILAEP